MIKPQSSKSKSKAPTAVVLGGYLNGYSVVRELAAFDDSIPIWIVDSRRSLATASNLICGWKKSHRNSASLHKTLESIAEVHGKLVLFSTNDLYLEQLAEIAREIEGFCFLPCNVARVKADMEKDRQYQICREVGVPFPAGIYITSKTQLEQIEELTFPLIVKPSKRDDLQVSVFRNIILESVACIKRYEKDLSNALSLGCSLVVSELIPGEDDQIYAYTAYRNRSGEILNEWAGRKLTQFPNQYGVFSMATNDVHPEVIRQGRLLVHALNVHGIAEPEFKFDHRDGKFKLMEVNLRPMMWHRVGHLSGVDLMVTQWCDALNLVVPKYKQANQNVRLVYMKHELLNLIFRSRYKRLFSCIRIWIAADSKFAVWNWRDPLPGLLDLISYPRRLLSLLRSQLRHS